MRKIQNGTTDCLHSGTAGILALASGFYRHEMEKLKALSYSVENSIQVQVKACFPHWPGRPLLLK